MDQEEEEPVKDEELLHLKEEIDKLCKKCKDLNIRKLYLQCQCYIPRPLKFKEYERFVDQPPVKIDMANIAKMKMDMKLQLYYMCGMKFSDKNDDNFRIEMTVARGSMYMESFFVEIEKTEEQFIVRSFSVPCAINMSDIVNEVSMKQYQDIPVFLQYLHRCINAFFHRREQLNNLAEYFETQDTKINIFSSHHMMYIELKMSSSSVINSNSDTEITFVLKYKWDSLVPVSVSYEKRDLSCSDQHALDIYLKYFYKRHLREAFTEIMFHRKVKSESLLEAQSNSREMKQNRSISQQSSVPSVSPKQKSSENIEMSSSSPNISDITTSQVFAAKVPKKGIVGPIAASTPYTSKKCLNMRRVEAKTQSPKKHQGSPERKQSHIRRYKQTKLKMETTSVGKK